MVIVLVMRILGWSRTAVMVGVVVHDGSFGSSRVRGLDNLYLCDASVFPTSVHVNPQLTVMGLAQYAAGRIVGRPAGDDRAIIA